MRLAERLRTELAEIGVRTRLREVGSWSEYIDLTTRGDYDLAVLGWQADTTDPNDFLSALLSSEVDRGDQPQPLPQRGHGRAAQAGPARPRSGESAPRSTARPRNCSSRTCRGCRCTTSPFSPRIAASVHGISVGPTGVLRYEKAWKTE